MTYAFLHKANKGSVYIACNFKHMDPDLFLQSRYVLYIVRTDVLPKQFCQGKRTGQDKEVYTLLNIIFERKNILTAYSGAWQPFSSTL